MTRRLAVLALVAGACSVDRSALDEDVFMCRRDGDCSEGYGCQLVGATGGGFCVPIADSADDCDGFTTADDLCLDECVPGGDDCDRELACISNDVEAGGAGYCAPADACSSDDECGDGEACLSTVIRDFVDAVWGPHDFPRPGELSCVPRCEGGEGCPEGTDCLAAFVTGVEYCLPRCGDDAACPLGFACFATPGTSIGICVPGVTGLECRDDASCLAGGCETFEGQDQQFQVCVTPCDGEAPPCTDATIVDGALNVYQCTPVSDGAGMPLGEFCLFRGGYLHACNLGRPGDCVDGLTCQEVPDGAGGTTPVCVRACTPDFAQPNQDANGDCADNAFCYPGSGFGFIDACVFDLADGAQCLFDDQCEGGACHLEAQCDQDEGLGCCGPP